MEMNMKEISEKIIRRAKGRKNIRMGIFLRELSRWELAKVES